MRPAGPQTALATISSVKFVRVGCFREPFTVTKTGLQKVGPRHCQFYVEKHVPERSDVGPVPERSLRGPGDLDAMGQTVPLAIPAAMSESFKTSAKAHIAAAVFGAGSGSTFPQTSSQHIFILPTFRIFRGKWRVRDQNHFQDATASPVLCRSAVG